MTSVAGVDPEKPAASAWAAAKGAMAGATAVAAGAWVAPQGGLAVAGLAAVAALAVAWLWRRQGRTTARDATHDGIPPSRQIVHTQASGLARQVVPVWQRNVDTARLHAEQSMGALTESFGSIIVGLEQALGGAAPPQQLDGATIDELLARHRPQIDQLLAATRRIAQAKDDMARGATELGDTLVETTRLTKEVQTIGRATHLLALNASVEAARAASGGGASAAGFAAVAQEVQHLATQSRQAGQELARHLTRMQDRVQSMRLQGARLNSDDDELMLQAEQQARALVWALLAGLSEVTRSQRSLHDAGQQVQTEMERILVSLQSQDRLNQMLQSVTEDMQRLHAWLEGQPDDAAASAHKWLERLESSYTMEEMRTSHHGTVQVEKASEVEFF